MTIVEMESFNKIDKNDFNNIAQMLLKSFLIENHYKNNEVIDRKEELLISFSSFLEKYLELQFFNSADDKLQLINFIDKLQLQRELLELEKGQNKPSDLKLAAKRLGRKSQSAFESK